VSRPFVILCSHVRIFVCVPFKVVVPLHVGIKGFRINWVRLGQFCLLLRSQTHPDSRVERSSEDGALAVELRSDEGEIDKNFLS
jgi:hypothetical protein